MTIFNSYVKFPEGKTCSEHLNFGSSIPSPVPPPQLPAPLQELIDLTAPTFVKELDYEIEASNQRRFAQTVEDCELIRDTIAVPEILFANCHLEGVNALAFLGSQCW